jgi:hypothetical protein
MRKFITFLLILLISLLLFGCVVNSPENPVETTIYPTPTTHELFNKGSGKVTDSAGDSTETLVPTLANYFSEPKRPTETLTPTVIPTFSPTPTVSTEMITTTEVITVSIFDDALDKNWIAVPNGKLLIDLEANDPVRSGNRSIGVISGESFSSVNFLVSKNTTKKYLRDRVVGFRFWLNSGDGSILISDLAVTILGSNDYPYWVEDDDSVTNTFSPVFSETRLYYLGVNRTIPPKTWVKINVPIHELIFDPDYNYLVGFYIKNDEGVTSEYFLDDIELVTLPGGIVPSDFTPAPSSGRIE